MNRTLQIAPLLIISLFAFSDSGYAANATLRANCTNEGHQYFDGTGSHCPVARNEAVRGFNKAFDDKQVCSTSSVKNTAWVETTNCSNNPDKDWTHYCLGPMADAGTLYIYWSTGYSERRVVKNELVRIPDHSLTSEDNLLACRGDAGVTANGCTARGAIKLNCVEIPLEGISP